MFACVRAQAGGGCSLGGTNIARLCCLLEQFLCLSSISLLFSGLFPLFFPCAQSSTKPYAYVGCSCSASFWQRLSSLVFEQASVTSTSAPPWFIAASSRLSMSLSCSKFSSSRGKSPVGHKSMMIHTLTGVTKGHRGHIKTSHLLTPAENAKSWTPWHHQDETGYKNPVHKRY